MKQFLTLSLLLVCFSVLSQEQRFPPPWRPFPRKVKHVVLIRNDKRHTIYRITENSNIFIRTSKGKSYSGKVLSIKSDTIFLNDTFVKVSEIDSLSFFFPMGFPGHDEFNNPGMRPYVSTWPENKIICPPENSYSTPLTYQDYYRDILKSAKHDWREQRNPLTYKNFVKFNLAKLAHLEIAFSYERLIGKDVTWETEISAIFGANANPMDITSYPLFNYSGVSITTYPKFFCTPKFYVSPVFMYRNLYFTNVNLDWPDNGNQIELQDQYRTDYGMSLRLGVMVRYRRFIIDYYAGIGAKYYLLQQRIYGRYDDYDEYVRYYNNDHSPNIVNTDGLGIILNLGIKMGVAF
jgi:hypothetical protein